MLFLIGRGFYWLLDRNKIFRIEAVAQLFAKAAHEAAEVRVALSQIITEPPVNALMGVVLDLTNDIDLRSLLVVDILVEVFEILLGYRVLVDIFILGFTADRDSVGNLAWSWDAASPRHDFVVAVVLNDLIDVDHGICLGKSLPWLHLLLKVDITLRLCQVLPTHRLVPSIVQLILVDF